MATRLETQEMVKVMHEYVEGKEVEYRPAHSVLPWRSDTPPVWDWSHNDYRVKPAPREWWLVSTNCQLKAFPNRTDAEEEAERCCSIESHSPFIHVREVLDE